MKFEDLDLEKILITSAGNDDWILYFVENITEDSVMLRAYWIDEKAKKIKRHHSWITKDRFQDRSLMFCRSDFADDFKDKWAKHLMIKKLLTSELENWK